MSLLTAWEPNPIAHEVAVAIAVQRAGSLIALPGALEGARDFAKWADEQGYETHLVTDEHEQGTVTVFALRELMKRIVQEQPDRLLLYFAGHGIQPSPNTPYWLLSGWEADSNEAVNVNLSNYNAKRSGIAQIAIFADACRSTVPGAAGVGGASIFPKSPPPAGRLPQWDHYYATRIEEIAQEVPASKATKAYGVFTRCLMVALSGDAQAAFEERPGKHPSHAVTSQALASYLEDAVPRESGMIPGAVVQFPEAMPGWRPERNFYFGRDAAPKRDFSDVRAGSSSDLESRPERATRAVEDATQTAEARLRASIEAFAAARGRESFETRQGVTVIGAVPTAFSVRGGHGAQDLFKEGDAWHVRGHGGGPHSVAIELENDRWVAACILPDLVATIVVEGGVSASLNYAPARGGLYDSERDLSMAIAPAINRFTALLSQGRYVAPDELTNLAETLRVSKHSNPALGVLASYAYERAGDPIEIEDVAWWFAFKGQPVPFDVAMLARAPSEPEQGRRFIRVRGKNGDVQGAWVAGSFPLLTQGWSFLDPADRIVHPEIFGLRAGLLPGLWATLRAEEGRRLAELIREGLVE
jgi:hypothetical protein